MLCYCGMAENLCAKKQKQKQKNPRKSITHRKNIIFFNISAYSCSPKADSEFHENYREQIFFFLIWREGLNEANELLQPLKAVYCMPCEEGEVLYALTPYTTEHDTAIK